MDGPSRRWRSLACLRTFGRSGPLSAGDVRLARPAEREHPLRAVVVLDVHDGGRWANAYLLSEALELAGAYDLCLQPAETGLPFACIVETDVVAPLFAHQLGPALGRLAPDALAAVHSALGGKQDVLRSGLPITEHGPRWDWKTSEVAVMHALGGACLRSLLDGAGQGPCMAE